MTPAAMSGRHVALLRGINVGGSSVILMEDLRALFTRAGAAEVSTYIQSGNVIFSATARSLPGIQRKARVELEKRVGTRAAIAIRAADALHAMVDDDPFAAVRAGAEVKRYVLFLAGAPAVRPRVPVRNEKEGCEVIAHRGLDLFVLSRPLKGGRYGSPYRWVERDLDVVATIRNWNTVTKLASLTR